MLYLCMLHLAARREAFLRLAARRNAFVMEVVHGADEERDHENHPGVRHRGLGWRCVRVLALFRPSDRYAEE